MNVIRIANLYGYNGGNFGGNIYDTCGLSPTINCMGGGNRMPLIIIPVSEGRRYRIRKLTPREVGRLMDVSDSDIDRIEATGLSRTAMYKMYGNSICVGVMFHLFRKLFIETENENQQLSLF